MDDKPLCGQYFGILNYAVGDTHSVRTKMTKSLPLSWQWTSTSSTLDSIWFTWSVPQHIYIERLENGETMALFSTSHRTFFHLFDILQKNFDSKKLRGEPNRSAWAAGKSHCRDQRFVCRVAHLSLSQPHVFHYCCPSAHGCTATYAVTLPSSWPYYFSSLLSLLVEPPTLWVSSLSPLYKSSPCLTFPPGFFFQGSCKQAAPPLTLDPNSNSKF
jgi:hypothetical protein